MNSATRLMTSTFGALVGLIGIEHGIGETLQGNVTPDGLMILSWPGSGLFQVLGGEPAMTIVPNLLVTGTLAILFSLIYLVWAILFVQKKNGGLVLILLSLIMVLVGGGIFPPILGIIIGSIGTRINSPLTWWRGRLSYDAQKLLAKVWPLSFGVYLFSSLSMFPGLLLLGYFVGVNDPTFILFLLVCMFGSLFLTFVAGIAHDIRQGNRGLPQQQVPRGATA